MDRMIFRVVHSGSTRKNNSERHAPWGEKRNYKVLYKAISPNEYSTDREGNQQNGFYLGKCIK